MNSFLTQSRPGLVENTVHDPSFAARLGRLFRAELALISAFSYRSLITAREYPDLSERFDRVAQEETGHFRTLRDLITALGGTASVYANVRPDPDAEHPGNAPVPSPDGIVRLIRQSETELRDSIDLCETLMGKTPDRVVRSIMQEILLSKQSLVFRLLECL